MGDQVVTCAYALLTGTTKRLRFYRGGFCCSGRGCPFPGAAIRWQPAGTDKLSRRAAAVASMHKPSKLLRFNV